jgi:hypothetical protein
MLSEDAASIGRGVPGIPRRGWFLDGPGPSLEARVKTTPYYTILPENPRVHHDDTSCSEGKKIKEEHKRYGTPGRLCEVCAKL